MPGMKPLCASWRRHRRHRPNLRYTARGRPHRRQRECWRVLYLGVRCEATILDVLAIREVLSCLCGDRVGAEALVLPRAPVTGEGQAERVQQRERLGVRVGGRGDRDVQAPDLIDLVVVDLREDDVLLDARVVVATAVEGLRVQAPEVTQARDGHGDQAIQELVRALVAQGDGEAHRHALAQLERGDRLAGATDVRLLARDVGELRLGSLEHLGVLLGLADAHVERHLDQLRRLHRRRVAERLHELSADLVVVTVLESCHQSSSVPERRDTRLRTPPSRVTPTRVGLWSFGSTNATLEMWIDASRSMTPTSRFGRPGTGRWWRLIMFRPSTYTRWFAGSTRMTLPVFPLSLPEITITLSSVRIFAMARAPPGRARRSS